MRKFMALTVLLALFSLSAWTGAQACGNKSTGNKSASAGACAGKATAAQTVSADKPIEAQNVSTDKAIAAQNAGAGGHCSPSADAAAMKAGCPAMPGCPADCTSKNMTQASNADFVSAYMQVQKGLVQGSGCSTNSAVSAWRAAIKEIVAGKSAPADAQSLVTLDATLAAWPSEIAQQRQAFAAVSEWMISYCQNHPELAKGTSIARCPDSGFRWVESPEIKGNPYTG